MPRVVLFGGGGFVGSALRSGLTGGDVVAPSRHDADLTDRAALVRLLRPGDLIVNAAGYAVATDRTPAGIERFRRDNIEGPRILAEAAIETGAAHLVHLSSVAAMGHREGVGLREDDLAPPRTPYGRSKRDGELVLAARMERLPITILRPTSVFGEGRGLAAMLCRVATLPVVPLPGGGRALIPFSHLGNLVAAVDATLGRPATFGRTFIVGDAGSYPLRDVVTGLAAELGRPRVRTVPVPTGLVRAIGTVETRLARLRGRAPLLDPVRIETVTSSVSYSTAAFRDATGFEAPVDLPTALRRIAAWYRGRAPR